MSKIDDFALVDKRQMLRYNLDWNDHFIMTYNKMPNFVCLNIDKLGELSEDDRISLLVDLLGYLYD